MARKKAEEKLNLDSILFKCRDILRNARNSGSFFEKRDMMLTLVFLRFIGEKFEDGIEKLRQQLIADGLDPEDPELLTDPQAELARNAAAATFYYWKTAIDYKDAHKPSTTK